MELLSKLFGPPTVLAYIMRSKSFMNIGPKFTTVVKILHVIFALIIVEPLVLTYVFLLFEACAKSTNRMDLSSRGSLMKSYVLAEKCI